MNAPYATEADMITSDDSRDTDSDNSDGIPDYYEPISSHDDDSTQPSSNGHHIINLNTTIQNDRNTLENGLIHLDLRENEEEEEERRILEAEEAMHRAFEEDESRRNAPLTTENATRVIEAMRGVSFSGLPLNWPSGISEDHLFGQLRRLRRPPSSAT